MAEGRRQMVAIGYQKARQEGLLKLARIYTDARLQKSVVKLQREAQKRAAALVRFVHRGVRDGLREKVDLYRAQGHVHFQRERVQSALQSLEVALEKLSSVLHRRVQEGEIELYKAADVQQFGKSPSSENVELKLLAARETLLQKRLDEVNRRFYPQVTLSIGRQTNAVGSERSEVWRSGRLDKSSRRADSLSLNVNWPIGNRSERVERAQIRAEKASVGAQKRKLQQNISLRTAHMEKQMSHFQQSIREAHKRRELARRVVGELGRLYRRGRSDWEQVIRAEEDFIGTEKNLVQHLARRDTLSHALVHLRGGLEQAFLGDPL